MDIMRDVLQPGAEHVWALRPPPPGGGRGPSTENSGKKCRHGLLIFAFMELVMCAMPADVPATMLDVHAAVELCHDELIQTVGVAQWIVHAVQMQGWASSC